MSAIAYASVQAAEQVIGVQGGNSLPQEVDLAHELGFNAIRCQPSWGGTESTGGALALNAEHIAALAKMAAYGMAPIYVAGYAPPARQAYTYTLARAAAAGDASLLVDRDASGEIAPLNDFVLAQPGNKQITAKISANNGSLISGVSGNTLALASKVTTPLAAGTQVGIKRSLYRPIFNDDPEDLYTKASIAAYLRYVRFLAEQIDAAGCERGYICLWNEDEWLKEPWNHGIRFFDTPPAGITKTYQLQRICAEALKIEDLPPGVRLIQGGTDKTGSASLVWTKKTSPTPAQVAATITHEGIHDYGRQPEAHAWDPATFKVLWAGDVTDNWPLMANKQAISGTGLKIAATECGINYGSPERRATYLTRRVLSHIGAGIDVQSIYSLAAADFGIVTKQGPAKTPTFTRHQEAEALQQLNQSLQNLGGEWGSAPDVEFLSEDGCDDQLLVVQARGVNGTAIYMWQRSETPPGYYWGDQPKPARSGVAKFYIPRGASIRSTQRLVNSEANAPTIVTEDCPCGVNQILTVGGIDDSPLFVVVV